MEEKCVFKKKKVKYVTLFPAMMSFQEHCLGY